MRKLFIAILSLAIALTIHSAVLPVKAQNNPLDATVSDKQDPPYAPANPDCALGHDKFGGCLPDPAPVEPEPVIEMVGK